MSSSASPTSTLPSIILLCLDKAYEKAFTKAAKNHALPATLKISFKHKRFNELPSSVKFDAIVSPANSFGVMDGGFDHALSAAFSPRDDYLALTRIARKALYREYRGFAPPGSCTIVKLEGEPELKENEWGCKYMAISPSMKVPQDVRWDREIVYECVWMLCVAIDRHNRQVRDGGEASEIRQVLMTPIATGCGKVSAEKWAAQTVLALKHFVEAAETGKEWAVQASHDEVEKTYGL